MEIREQIIKLYQLSQFDFGLHEFEVELREIPEKIAEIEQDLNAIQSRFDTEQGRLEALQKAYRDKETELEDSRRWIKESEAKLYRIKTQKEYQAGVSEIAERKQSLAGLEEEMIDLMGQIEDLQAVVKRLEPELAAKKTECAEEIAQLQERKAEIEAKLKAEHEVWMQKAEGIDEKLLDLYKSARQENADVVSFVDRGACLGCYFSLPPQLVIEVQRMQTVHTCPTCHRLLFLESTIENPAQATSES